jgi:c-di-GMP-related signal transduction protein
LFRDGVESYFCPADPEAASRSTLDSSLLMGLDVLCDGRRAFINCTRDMLLKDCVTLLPSGQTVVEILESVEPDELVIAACHRLKEAGYMIALDDFAVNDPRQALTDIADILKVDVRTTSPEERAAMAPSAAACWLRKSKRARNLWPHRKPASYIFRATSSAGRRP